MKVKGRVSSRQPYLIEGEIRRLARREVVALGSCEDEAVGCRGSAAEISRSGKCDAWNSSLSFRKNHEPIAKFKFHAIVKAHRRRLLHDYNVDMAASLHENMYEGQSAPVVPQAKDAGFMCFRC